MKLRWQDGSPSVKTMAPSGPTRSVPRVAIQAYSSSVRPSSSGMVRRAAMISGRGVGWGGGAAWTGPLCDGVLISAYWVSGEYALGDISTSCCSAVPWRGKEICDEEL